jgi:hypothetical protein
MASAINMLCGQSINLSISHEMTNPKVRLL